MDQTIVFWNRAAERILGYSSEEVLGRRCSELLAGILADGSTADCQPQCPSIRAIQNGRLPSPKQLHLISASGEPIEVHLTPIIVGGSDGEPQLVVELFTDEVAESKFGETGTTAKPLPAESDSGVVPNLQRLTKREMEVLRLVSAGWDTPRIAYELRISPHTVLNHIRHFRRKLDAPTKLDAVVTAIRLGMLPIE